jgi:G3E family GTPase
MVLRSAVQSTKVPVIVLSGFLGSGKTTLLNRVLAAPRGARVAVVVNEFASIGIDHHLMLSSEQQIMQVNNGCICCDVRGDLIAGLYRLMDMRSKFDIVFIETSGMAEPAPVAQALYADERIRREFGLQGVVTMVDAKHFTARLNDASQAAHQIAFADLILLNKIDLVTADELDRLELEIRTINSAATIIRTRNSLIDLDEIFRAGASQSQSRAGFICEDAGPQVAGKKHLSGVETVSIVEPGALDGTKLSLWFRELMSTMGPSLLRMKGVLNIGGDADRFFFQGVQMEFEGRPGPAWGKEERLNRLVFIGRNLDGERMRKEFRTCLVTDKEPGTALARDFGGHEEASPHRLEQIRYWLRQNFNFPADAPIVIKEVPCMKPSCPPTETAIVAILKDEPPRLFKIQHVINEITFDHVYDLMENPMPCC